MSAEPFIHSQVPQVPAEVVGDIQFEIAVAASSESQALSVRREGRLDGVRQNRLQSRVSGTELHGVDVVGLRLLGFPAKANPVPSGNQDTPPTEITDGGTGTLRRISPAAETA